MGLFDRFRERLAPRQQHGTPSYGTPFYGTPAGASRGRGTEPRDPDEVAVERYRYLLRTAPPETVEQAHEEAFARLTPQQRQQVLAELGAAVPAGERARTSEPRELARMATRAELREPGLLERTFGGYGRGRPGMGGRMGGGGTGGLGLGGVIGGSLLGSVAGAFIGTAIAEELFDDDGFGGDGFLDNDGPFDGDGAGTGQADAAADVGDDGYEAAGLDDSGFDDGGFDDGGFDDGGFDGGDFGGGDF